MNAAAPQVAADYSNETGLPLSTETIRKIWADASKPLTTTTTTPTKKGRPRIRTPSRKKIIDFVEDESVPSSSKSIRKISDASPELLSEKISRTTVNKILREAKMHPYKIKKA